MEAFILALVYALPGPLRPIARPVADRLLQVWRWSESLARRLRSAHAAVLLAAVRLRDGIRNLGYETYQSVKWLIVAAIPRAIRSARDAIIRWATARINEARGLARALVANLQRWATAAIGTLRSGLEVLRRWAAGLLADALAGIRRLVARVFGTWNTPARLAAWLVGAMWMALWRYAWGQMDRIAEALWARRRVILLRTVAEAERLLGRLL